MKRKKEADLGVRKESAERGVRGSNLKDDKPVGAWKRKPSGANEDVDGMRSAETGLAGD